MKIGMFSTVRGGIERFAPHAAAYNGEVELVRFDVPPTVENLELARGCDALIYTSADKAPEEFWAKMAEVGIHFVATPTTGYDHFDLEAMKKYGIRSANVPFYSPNSVAEHAVLSVLALLRLYRKQFLLTEKNVYGLAGLMGKEMRNQTVGIVGAGRIGFTTMKCLSGFGPKAIIAYDLYPNDTVKELAEYVSLEELYERADVIIYHCVYNETNHHMVNKESIAKMKDGVLLVNVARGPIFDTKAVLEGMKSGKLGGVALDVLEEEGVLKGKTQLDDCPIPELKELMTYPNFIFTNHSAFFTDEADKDMSKMPVDNLYEFVTTGECPYELKA